MNALGIDPGTSSFDVCCFDDESGMVVFEASVPTSTVAKSPERLLGVVLEADADVIVGPSAMGLPVTHIADLTDRTLAQATLGKNTEVDIAIRRFITMQQEHKLNVFFTPGIIQLPPCPGTGNGTRSIWARRTRPVSPRSRSGTTRAATARSMKTPASWCSSWGSGSMRSWPSSMAS